MPNSDDFWEGIGRVTTFWELLLLLSGGGGMLTTALLRNMPPYIPISFGIVSGLLIIWGIARTITNYRTWKIRNNQKYPELDNVIRTLWDMHLMLGQLIQPSYEKVFRTKLIKKLSSKFTELIGIPPEKSSHLKLNFFTYVGILIRLGTIYRINAKKVITLTNVSTEIGDLMDKSGVGISDCMEDKAFNKLHKVFDNQTLALNIKPETSILIDKVYKLSFGLCSVKILGHAMLRNKRFSDWLGIPGHKICNNFLLNTDSLYKASLFELKKAVLKDLSEI
ncbi:MAG: hypothetical protein HW402_222 [Dehalococcoidales bacterium]|nr:hypothetical protein [Dehalococcoidales bacterium]